MLLVRYLVFRVRLGFTIRCPTSPHALPVCLAVLAIHLRQHSVSVVLLDCFRKPRGRRVVPLVLLGPFLLADRLTVPTALPVIFQSPVPRSVPRACQELSVTPRRPRHVTTVPPERCLHCQHQLHVPCVQRACLAGKGRAVAVRVPQT